MIESLINFILSIPEILPNLSIPGIESTIVATWLLILLLIIWLFGLIRRSI